MRERLLNFLKFFIFLFIIPIVIATTISFGKQLQMIEASFRAAWLGGVYLYVVMHLFFYEPVELLNFGQGLISGLFRFSEAVSVVAKYIFPFYTLLLLGAYYFLVVLGGIGGIWPYFIFAFIGFTITMHVVLTAHNLHEEDASFIKPHYFSAISLTYMGNVILLACLFSLIFDQFLLAEFFRILFNISGMIYSRAFHQLFVPSS